MRGNAQVSGYYFHELHAGGLPNGQGIAIDGFFSGEGAAHRVPVGTPMVLDVQGDRLMGLVDGHPSIEGTELVGATIRLWFPGTPNSAIEIKQVYETEFWVSAADGPEHATLYELENEWRRPICDPPELGIPPAEGSVALGATEPSNLAVFFAGDRYERQSGTVQVPGEAGWFNLGCVGTALAKMHLLRHTSGGNGSITTPTDLQRQAMLRLLAADYCGDGRTYAVNGHPLFFRDQDGRFDPTPWWGDRIAELEAIWTEAGALCLDEPRRWDPWRSYAEHRAQIVADCESSPVESRRRTIPRCTAEQVASWSTYGPISRNVDPP